MPYEISIIIPFLDAYKFINSSFQNSRDIIKNRNIQIIYVDNNSKDKSALILKKKINNTKDILLLKTTKSMGIGPGVARNLGTKFASGRKILFLDVDDKLTINKVAKLVKFSKKNNYNLVYLGKKLIKSKKSQNKKLSPFLKYHKNNLKKFFRNSNNMQVISILFDKKFIKRNNLVFNKGIYEDIFFLFKAHFYNNKKICNLKEKFYLKISHKNSIINSSLSLYHLKWMFNAWKSIDKFVKTKVPMSEYKKLYPSIQYRLRGEFSNEYNKILNCKLSNYHKNKFLNYVKQNYKNIICSNFVAKTEKDKIVKKILNYSFRFKER